MVNINPDKLVFVIHSLDGGGAERVLSNLANFHSEKGFEVMVVCLNKVDPAYFLAPEIKITYLINSHKKSGFFYRTWYAIVSFFKLFLLLKREKPRCTISFTTSDNLWTGLVFYLSKTPYILSERISPDRNLNRFNHLKKHYAAAIFRCARAVVMPVSSIAASYKKTKAFSKLHNIEVINNPVPQFPAPALKRIYPNRFILGVGKLEYHKGFDLLIIAFRRVQQKDVHLLISGEGPQREELEEQIESMGLKHRIKLIGFQKNIQDYYHQSELFVLPSRNEGYPNTLLEAMSLGKACIASDCNYGPSDIIENTHNGLLIKKENIYRLADAMEKLLNDPIIKAKITMNAKQINQTNSSDQTSAKWLELVMRVS